MLKRRLYSIRRFGARRSISKLFSSRNFQFVLKYGFTRDSKDTIVFVLYRLLPFLSAMSFRQSASDGGVGAGHVRATLYSQRVDRVS